MKRFFGLFLLLSILCGALFFVEAFAEEETSKVQFLSPSYQKNSGPSYDALDVYVDMPALRAFLVEKIAECKDVIYLYEYRIPSILIDELAFYIWKDIPEAFHVDGLGYTTEEDDYVDYLYLDYEVNKSTYGKLMNQCKDIAAKMIEGLDAPELSELDKALILHDRLAVHNEYDLSLKAPFTHEMVGALVYRTSVCEGYAMAYSYLLDQVGIRNYYCQSIVINHGWNIVYIDGVKYHVDVTWDDPLYDRMGQVYHDNFMRSTEGMLETGHYNKNGEYDFDSTPVDTRYDNAYWQKSETAFQVIDGKLYYIHMGSWESSATLKQVDSGEHKVIADVSDAWYVSQCNWGDGYQVLSSDGRDLFYSGADAIYRYCFDTKRAEVIWKPTLPADTAIFGFKFEDGFFNCVYLDSPNFEEDTNYTNLIRQSYTPHYHAHEHIYTDACDADCNICTLTRIPPHAYDGATDLICNLCSHERPPYISGDVDGNEKVDLDDAIHLLYHINFPASYKVNQPTDFDGNGVLSLDDAIYLLYHVSFPAQYPLH